MAIRSWRLWMEVMLALVRYVPECAGRSRTELRCARALWLQGAARRALRVLGMETRVTGSIPQDGLLVCNHLSYLDILVLSALTPCVFVAKHEVKRWPVFGWLARLGGTVFVHREKRLMTGRAAAAIDVALREGALVVLFPEGTSSGGETVLPFKSALLAPAALQSCELTAGLIRYELEDGCVSEEVCYWKNMTLLPHLLNVLRKRSLRAHVTLAPYREKRVERKELARRLHQMVVRLKESAAL